MWDLNIDLNANSELLSSLFLDIGFIMHSNMDIGVSNNFEAVIDHFWTIRTVANRGLLD